MKKGISPIISAVLLMAFVIAIAASVSEWGTVLVQDAQDQNVEEQQQIMDCNDVGLEILSYEEDYDGVGLILTIESDGPAVGDITATAIGPNDVVSERGNIDTSGGVIDITLDVDSQPNEVRVASEQCPGAQATLNFD